MSLKAKGWTHAEAALVIGCHRVHLTQVLRGARTSRPVLEAIDRLPTFDEYEAQRSQLRAA